MTTVKFKGKVPWEALSAMVRIGGLAIALLFAAGASAAGQAGGGNRSGFIQQLFNPLFLHFILFIYILKQ